MPDSQRPDGTVAGSTKRLATRFYQLKTGHARTGEYLHWTRARPTAQCWWCPHPKQTREHLLKGCPRWRKQQRVLWKEVWKETGGGRFRWKAHELFADQRCSQAVLDFLSSTDVGRLAPPLEEEDAVSAVSEMEMQEWMEVLLLLSRCPASTGTRRPPRGRAEVLGGAEAFLPMPDFMASAGTE